MRTLLALPVVGALFLAAAPAAEARSKPCSSKGSTTVVKNKFGRVFTKKRRTDSEAEYGCLYRFDRRVRLDRRSYDLDVHSFKLGSRYVGYIETDSNCGACAHGYDAMNVVDLRKRRVKLDAKGNEAATGETEIHAFVMKANGSVAWTSSGEVAGVESSQEVLKADAGGATLLDRYRYDATRRPSPDPRQIELRSLALSDDAGTVYWTKAGRPASAPLD